MNTTPPRFYRYRTLKAATTPCVCGHISYVHNDEGKGACMGFLTVFDDGIDGIHFCDCQRFTERAK